MTSKYGSKQLVHNNYVFNRHVFRGDITYWRCTQYSVYKCRARIRTKNERVDVLNPEHNHAVITEPRKYGSLKNMRVAT